MFKFKKSFDLHLENDAEWQTLKMALCHLRYLSSCYESLDSDYRISGDLLKRLGVWSLPDECDNEIVL